MEETIGRPFVGRAYELARLRGQLEVGRGTLTLVEGRRRVGKTALVLRAVRRELTVYFLGAQVTDSMNLAGFRREAAPALGDPPGGLRNGEGWTELLVRLGRRSAETDPRLTVVLDGFTQLVEVNPKVPAAVAKAWDLIRRRGDPLKLVLVGSDLPVMEAAADADGPLGRFVDARLRVAPLPIQDAARLLPGWTAEARMYAYGVFGGMPHYLAMVDPARSLSENLVRLVLHPSAPLLEEAERLLHAELGSLPRYATILGAIAAGGHDTRAIVSRVREVRSGADLTYYIEQLRARGYIDVVQPLGRSGPRTPRRYEVADPFLAFWFRFVMPNRSALASGGAPDVLRSRVVPALDAHTAPVFCRVCREWVQQEGRELLGAPVREVGRIWGRDLELPVAIRMADGSMAFGACRWEAAPAGPSVLAELREAVARSGLAAGGKPRFLLFSGSGFAGELWEAAARDDDVHLVPLERMMPA